VVRASDRVVRASDRVVRASDRVVRGSDRIATGAIRGGAWASVERERNPRAGLEADLAGCDEAGMDIEIPAETIDRAVRSVLELKFKLGLFDRFYLRSRLRHASLGAP